MRTCRQFSGTGWTITQLGATVMAQRGDALAGASSYPPLTLTVNVAANAPASVTNTATVSGGSETNTANDSGSDPTTIGPSPIDLTVTKTHVGNFVQGQTQSSIFQRRQGSGADLIVLFQK